MWRRPRAKCFATINCTRNSPSMPRTSDLNPSLHRKSQTGRLGNSTLYLNEMYFNKRQISSHLFRRGVFLPLPAYDAHGRRIILERCANGLPLDLIDANCHVIPWSFTQMLYSDKQAQVWITQSLEFEKLFYVILSRSTEFPLICFDQKICRYSGLVLLA